MPAEITAPMPGKILDILVNVGDRVNEDDETVILEAMKMENPIYSPSAGIVREIKVGKGDHVDSDQVLVVLE